MPPHARVKSWITIDPACNALSLVHNNAHDDARRSRASPHSASARVARAMPDPRPKRPPDSTLLFRVMNPELFYTVPKPALAVAAAVVAVACVNTARLVLEAPPKPHRARLDDDDDDDDDDD